MAPRILTIKGAWTQASGPWTLRADDDRMRIMGNKEKELWHTEMAGSLSPRRGLAWTIASAYRKYA
jgi:hypothetical protein